MKEIKKVAVIGSGVMGSGIAAHIANSNTHVLLLDIVKDGSNRNALAENALERLKKSSPAAFTHKSKAKYVTPGNLEDHLHLLKDVDWVIEAVIEKLEVKKSVYQKVNANRQKDTIISSNTSTIPLKMLTEGMPQEFKKHFCVTHFFNPPRYMRLLELVSGAETLPEVLRRAAHFADYKLGKGVVACKDTPGFIANRIGCFWLQVGMLEAMRLGLTVEEADSVMGKPVGIPKTGVFGLMDLIGIDLLPLIAKELKDTLPPSDPFCQIYTEPPLITRMIKEGYTGRKGKGGFYRVTKETGKSVKGAIDLQTGEYRPVQKPKLESVDAAKGGLPKLVDHPDLGGQYAKSVLTQTLAYAASLVPGISDRVEDVDQAMRLGYNWKYGPFELLDKLGGKKLKDKESFQFFYREEQGQKQALSEDGSYHPIHKQVGQWNLSDIKRGNKPVKKNASAALWDVGDGVLCFEIISKMNTFDPMVLELIMASVEIVKRNHKALIIGHDGDNFSVGANIGILLYASNLAAWKAIDGIIRQGQDAFMALKYAPFPVVGAPSGMALGGGCEILLHCDALAAHVETYTGLVEVGVGLIPGWGGCKEMVLRHMKHRAESDRLAAKMGGLFSFIPPVKTLNAMPPLSKAFEYISMAKVSTSAEEAREMGILNDKSIIVMNRARVLDEAKKLALSLAKNYQVPTLGVVSLPGRTARAAFHMAVSGFVKSGKATAYDEVVSKAVAYVLSGGPTDITETVTEQQLLDLEREQFVEMVKHPQTLDRIEHMLETGKPLRN